MLRPPAGVRVFLCTAAADMRRSFDGLTGLVCGVLKEDPLSGHLFVFRNRRGDRIKVLYFDRDGLVIVYKRLEEGVFKFPASPASGARLEIPMRDFAMILEGFEVEALRRQRRYSRAAP